MALISICVYEKGTSVFICLRTNITKEVPMQGFIIKLLDLKEDLDSIHTVSQIRQTDFVEI